MQVAAVLVDEIFIASGSPGAVAVATLYEFPEPRWVSTHPDRHGRRLGPLTLVESPGGHSDQEELPDISIRPFRKRPLHVEPQTHLAISYRDRWTVPPWTVYALVLPPGHVATVLRLLRHERGSWQPDMQVAASQDRRIFYHTVFGWSHDREIFDIEVRMEPDEQRYEQLRVSAEAVAGTGNYEQLRNAVRSGTTSSDFWFRLLELGGKLFGSS